MSCLSGRCAGSALRVHAGPSRRPIEALSRASLSTCVPCLRRKPLPPAGKLPKSRRRGYELKPVGIGPGMRPPKREKQVVAYLAKASELGEAGDTILATKGTMRHQLIPQGKAYYLRNGQPVVWPPPLRDWVPPDVEEQRLEAKRDRQIGYLFSPRPRNTFFERNQAKIALLDKQIAINQQETRERAFVGGRTRAQRERDMELASIQSPDTEDHAPSASPADPPTQRSAGPIVETYRTGV